MKVRAVSARTTNPNTSESDRQPRVWHTVTLNDGTTRTVLASDPIEAINTVNKELA